MNRLISALAILAAVWVSIWCGLVILSLFELPIAPELLEMLHRVLAEPSAFAIWIGLPTLLCLLVQVGRVNRALVEFSS